MVLQNPVVGLPGLQSERTAEIRRVIRSGRQTYLDSGAVVDGSLSRDPLNTGDVDVLSAGLVMGKITATGLYRPSIIGALTVAHTSDSATTMTVSAATATELNRLGASGTFNLTGPPTAAGTVATEQITYSAVNTTTGVITISVETVDFVVGSWLQPEDGGETPVTIIGDGSGIKVTDQDDSSVDVEFVHTGGGAAFLASGLIDASQIRNWPADAGMKNYLIAKLNGGAQADPGNAPFNFDNRF